MATPLAEVAEGNEIPTFVVIGAAGDGKSSIIKTLKKGGEQPDPEVGKRGQGVTKFITEYRIVGHGGATLSLIDTMGVGDMEQGITQLISGLKSVLQCNRQIDGLIVTTLLASNRLGAATQVVQQIIQHGLVKSAGGVSPWERVIVCGTQRDRCDEDEIAEFPQTARLFFKNCGCIPKDYQIATCSAKEKDGMAELLSKAASLGRVEMVWDPDWESNGGVQRMAAGVCKVIGGDATLMQLDMEMQLAWTEVLKQQARGFAVSSAADAMGKTGMIAVGKEINKEISKSVGREVITQYTANQAATGMGSGFLKGSGVAIAEGSELAVGNTMMKAMQTSGTATLHSSAGNVVVNVGTRTAVSQGVSAGASLGAGVAGAGAELLAGGFEATKDHKKIIGFAAQVGMAACIGAAGGPLAAAVGAGAGAINWVAGQTLGHVLEDEILNSKGEDNPKVLAYQAAKAKYDAAMKEAQK